MASPWYMQSPFGYVSSLFGQNSGSGNSSNNSSGNTSYVVNSNPGLVTANQNDANVFNNANLNNIGPGVVLGASTTSSNTPYGPYLNPPGTTSGGSSGGSSSSNGNSQNYQAPSIPTPDGGISDAELDAIYGGAVTGLNNQENDLRTNQPIIEGKIRQQGEEMKSPYDTRLTEGLQQLGRNETETNTQANNAMQQARQLYNELTQSLMSRFGGRNSAGEAGGELLGRSTQQQFGNISQNRTDNLQKIMDAGVNLKDFVFKAKSDIDKQVQTKVDEAQAWFKQQLNQINTNRAMIESDKAAKRYEALRARQDFVNQLKASQYNYEQQLHSWYLTTASDLAQKANSYAVPNVSADQLVANAQTGITDMQRAAAPSRQNVTGTSAVTAPSTQTTQPSTNNGVSLFNLGNTSGYSSLLNNLIPGLGY